jgi:hypothetical protein
VELFELLGAFAGIIAVVAAILFLLARMSGWSGLAKLYKTNGHPAGMFWRFRGGVLGRVSYGGSLTIGSGPRGLYLATVFPYKMSHPALLIPWDEIAVTFKKRWRLFDFCEFHFVKMPGARLLVNKTLGQLVLQEMGKKATIGQNFYPK